MLGFGSGNERTAVAGEFASVEFDGAEQVLKRDALAAAFDERAQGVEFLIVQRPVEDHVEVHAPLDAQDVGEKQVDVEPGTLDALAREIRGRGNKDIEDGFHRAAAGMGSLDQPARERKGGVQSRLAQMTVFGQQCSMSLPAIRHPDAPEGGFFVFDPFDMEALRQPDMTEEDYLATEPYSEVKREFLGGAVYAMSGASEPHNRISTNLIAMLYNRLRGRRCEAFGSDMQVKIVPAVSELGPSYYYPDAMIACDPTDTGNRWRERPSALFEITSKSTRRVDEREKRAAYLSIPSLEAYVRILQDQPAVVYHVRTPTVWKLEQVTGLEGVLRLPSLEIELPLAELYERVEFLL